MEEKKKVLLLVGIIPPYTCKDEFSKEMKEYYLLKAKDSLPDLKWEIKELIQDDLQSVPDKER